MLIPFIGNCRKPIAIGLVNMPQVANFYQNSPVSVPVSISLEDENTKERINVPTFN